MDSQMIMARRRDEDAQRTSPTGMEKYTVGHMEQTAHTEAQNAILIIPIITRTLLGTIAWGEPKEYGAHHRVTYSWAA